MNDKNRKPTQAITLRYTGTGTARTTATTENLTAARILQLAQEYGIPYPQNPQLAALLTQVKLGAEIPQSLYIALAAVLATIYQAAEQS